MRLRQVQSATRDVANSEADEPLDLLLGGKIALQGSQTPLSVRVGLYHNAQRPTP